MSENTPNSISNANSPKFNNLTTNKMFRRSSDAVVKLKSTCAQLFATKQSFIVFTLYILLFVNHGILVTASQDLYNGYDYNIVVVVLMTEVFKLFFSIGLYCKEHSLVSLKNDVCENKKVMLLYFVPAFLYCLYNNLSYVNLSAFDPTTYGLLLQFRVVLTGILFQMMFRKTLTKRQWMSLVLLTCGCMLQQVEFSEESYVSSKPRTMHLNVYAVFILVQVICSCLAGVYNEYLLKNEGANTNIFVQNVFMYLDSIVCNILALTFQGNVLEILSVDSLAKVFHYRVLLIMINNSIVGIVTSFFLKTMNSILKTFASALELVLTAMFCYLLFGIPIYLNTIIAIAIVLFAIYLYSENPVTNVVELDQKLSKEEKEPITCDV